MLNKLRTLFNLFRKGEEVANAAAWKNGTIAVNTVAAFLAAAFAVASSFGYTIDASPEQTEAVAGGIIAAVGIFNGVMHIVTSKKVGLPPQPENIDREPDWGWREPE